MESDYRYSLTEIAQDDFSRIIDYIVNTLLNPAAASSLADKIEDTLENLCRTPFTGTEVHNPFLTTDNVRKILVKNYILYYVVDPDSKEIIVIRIGHFLQDQDKLLSEI